MLGRLLSDGDDLQRDHVAFGIVHVAEEVGDAFAVLLRLARQGEARQFGAAVLVEDDQLVALAGGEPIAVCGLRLQDALGLAQCQHAPHHRTQFLLRPAEEIVQRTALLPEAPLELIQAALVDERHDRLGCRLDDARAPERRRRHRHVARQAPAPRLDRADIDRTERARIRLAQRARRIARLADALGLHRRQVVVEPVADHLVHQVQAIERVAAVGHASTGIGADAVVLDIAAGQCGTTQHDRNLQSLPRHFLEVLAHHHGGLHQQTRHADRVRMMILRRRQHIVQRHLDAEIDHPVAVVGQDDVDQVLADVVHVALHRGEHDGALLLSLHRSMNGSR